MVLILLTFAVAIPAPQDKLHKERAGAIVDQVSRATRTYAQHHGSFPQDIKTLAREGFLLVEKVPNDPWGKPIGFTQSEGTLTVAISNEQRTTSVRLRLKKIARRKTSAGDRAVGMVIEAIRAYRTIHCRAPKDLAALVNEPAVLIDRPRASLITLRLASYGAAVSVATGRPKPMREEQRKELQQQVAKLSSDDYKTREAAVEKMEAFGPAALPLIEEAIGSATDLEVTARLKTVAGRLKARRDRENAPTVKLIIFRRGRGLFSAARRASNERNAAASLKSMVTAQEIFRSNDLDRNSISDYWTGDIAGLYCLEVKATGNPVAALNDIGIASADGAPYAGEYANDNISYNGKLLLCENGVPKPKTGYLYRIMTTDPKGNPYAIDTGDGHAAHNFGRFGAVAYPSEYNVTGRYTFIVNEGARVFQKDTGGIPILRLPTAAELSSDWERVQ